MVCAVQHRIQRQEGVSRGARQHGGHASVQQESFKEPARTRSPFGLESAIERLSCLKVSSSDNSHNISSQAGAAEKARRVLKGKDILKLWRSSPSMLLARRSKQNMQPFLNIEAAILDEDEDYHPESATSAEHSESEEAESTPEAGAAPMAPRNSLGKKSMFPVLFSSLWHHHEAADDIAAAAMPMPQICSPA